MSKINELIQTLCPDGVEYKKLGDVATISRGNGFQKKDFVEEGRPCIHYGQIFMHYSKMGITTSKTLTCIDDDKYEKNAKALPNDIVMAVTSENVEDVCKCVVWEGDEPVAVSGHTAIFHTEMNSKFLAYWLDASDFYVQKVRLAHGAKVIEVTPAAMVDIVLPVPPLPVQEEIVRILDEYTELETELEAKLSEEIELKQKQYEVYRDELLTFGGDIERKVLSEICDVRDGTHDSPKRSFENDAKYLLTSKNVKNGTICYDGAYKISKNDYDEINKRSIVDVYDLLFTMIGTVGEVGLIIDEPDYAIKNVGLIKTGGDIILAKFLKYYLTSECVKQYIRENRSKGSQVFLALGKLRMLPVPVLDGAVMDELVSMLDKYDTYTRDMISTLNTELESRKKQYAYYRDQLLTFKRKE